MQAKNEPKLESKKEFIASLLSGKPKAEPVQKQPAYISTQP